MIDGLFSCLGCVQVQFFMGFNNCCAKEGNGIQIGLRSFQYSKPYYIQTMKDRLICCCKYHVEIDLLKDAMTKFNKHHHCKDCSCNCLACRPVIENPSESCVYSHSTIPCVRAWIEGALCPKPEGQEWNRKQCIIGKCPKCGVHKLRNWCNRDLDSLEKQLIEW
jgi:hypothetical protein